MAFDSQHRVWTPLFNFNGQRNSVPFPLTPAAPSTALAAVGVQVTWPDAHAYRYRVYRDGALIATLAGQSYNDTAVASGTHDYTISVGLADQITWSPQSPASTISLSAGSLIFNQPPDYVINIGTQSIDLSQFVSGGNSQKWFGRISGTFPKYVDIGFTTGVVGTDFREQGSFSSIIRVVDTKEEALLMDWTARSTGPGVLWAHDFRADVEVDKFRAPDGSGNYQVDGSGTSLIRRITSDGITGGCVEAWTPAGAVNGTRWARPLMPLPGDVGYVSDGTWRTADIGTVWTTNWGGFRRGMFGHRSHWSENAAEGKDGFNYIGDEFWIQVRYKNVNVYDPRHLYIPGGGGVVEGGGKAFYIDVCGGGSQEIIVNTPVYASRRFSMYTNFGGQPNSNLSAVQGDTNAGAISAQPGGDWANTCVYDSGYQSCWEYPDDAAGNDKTKFVTLLFHVIPGRQNATGSLTGRTINMASTALYRDTGIEVWKANYGETTYTKVWEKLDYAWAYDATSALWGDPLGFNVFVLSQYMNGDGAGPVPWGRRIAQIICSRKAIACPQVYP